MFPFLDSAVFKGRQFTTFQIICGLQVTVAMMALNNILGLWPSLTGFSAVLVIVPVATLLGSLGQRVRKRLITWTDARVHLISEMLSSTQPSLEYLSSYFMHHEPITCVASICMQNLHSMVAPIWHRPAHTFRSLHFTYRCEIRATQQYRYVKCHLSWVLWDTSLVFRKWGVVRLIL